MGISFGKLWLDQHGSSSTWRIEARPHVMVRLKRLFDRAVKSKGEIWLKHTDEICRELQWFMQRYPLEVSDEDLQRIEGGAAAFNRRAETFDGIINGTLEARKFDLALPLREYQKIAADLALRSRGLLIADDVGLGKTAEVIAMLTDPRTRPALIVTLTHLPLQWQREFRKFAPSLVTHVIKARTPYPLDRLPGPHDFIRPKRRFPDVLITNYHKLSGWAEVLAGVVKTIAFDEVQELRRSTSEKSQAAREIAEKADFRVGASATPIYNYGGEFFNVIDVLCPDSLGTREEFLREWCKGYGNNQQKASIEDPKAFGTYLREQGIMLRRTRKEVGRELPEIIKVPHYIECNQKALEELEEGEDAASELARIILAKDTAWEARGKASREFNQRMRQATGIGKAGFAAEFIRMLAENGENPVCFCWHRTVYDIIMGKLKGLNPVMYTGSESPQQKEAAFKEFVEGRAKVFLMSLRSGAGLDGLQGHSHTVVFCELDWSFGVHEQCLSEDTEVLTPNGFRGVSDVHIGDVVAGFNVSNGTIHWIAASAKTDRLLGVGETMVEIHTEKTDLRVTGEHRLVVRRKTRTTKGVGRSAWGFALARDVTGETRRFIPTCGNQEAAGVPLSDYELRFLGWFITDGNFNGRFVTIFQAEHQPWNKDLVEVLDGCGFSWRLYKRLNPNGNVMNLYVIPKGTFTQWSSSDLATMKTMLNSGDNYLAVSKALGRSPSAVGKKARKVARGTSVPAKDNRLGRGWEQIGPYLDKHLSPLLGEMSQQQLKQLLRGFRMGDGSKSPRLKNVIRITNTDKTLLDRIQSLCIRRGMSASISQRKPRPGRQLAYDIWVSPFGEAGVPRRCKTRELGEYGPAPRERVWCLTNELGTLVTRRHGKVAVVGNCEGRVHRDGQEEPVVAYYLLSDEGSDPIVSEVLGLKRAQIEPVRNPDAELVEKLQTGDDHIKRLAEAYLDRHKRKPVAVEPLPENVIPLRSAAPPKPTKAEPEPEPEEQP